MAINIDHTGAGQITLKSPSSGTGELTLPTGTTELASVDMLLGVGQTWQSFTTTGDTPQRQADVTYTNNTDRPIFISVSEGKSASFGDNRCQVVLSIDNVLSQQNGVLISQAQGFTHISASVSAIIPSGSSYRVNVFLLFGVPADLDWRELR